jgi:hypothetical protein
MRRARPAELIGVPMAIRDSLRPPKPTGKLESGLAAVLRA